MNLDGESVEAPVDLSALAPVTSDEAFARNVIAEVRRRGLVVAIDPLLGIGYFTRPVLLAAAALALLLVWRGTNPATRRPASVAEAVGVPPEFLAAVSGDAEPLP